MDNIFSANGVETSISAKASPLIEVQGSSICPVPLSNNRCGKDCENLVFCVCKDEFVVSKLPLCGVSECFEELSFGLHLFRRACH